MKKQSAKKNKDQVDSPCQEQQQQKQSQEKLQKIGQHNKAIIQQEKDKKKTKRLTKNRKIKGRKRRTSFTEKKKKVTKIANIHMPSHSQKAITAAKGTKMNSCTHRRNPYKIYQQNRKKQFFTKLNQQYIKQLESQKKDKQKNQIPQNRQNINMKESEANRKNPKQHKQVIFNEKIQVRSYSQQDMAAQIKNTQVELEDVNQQENKLDC